MEELKIAQEIARHFEGCHCNTSMDAYRREDSLGVEALSKRLNALFNDPIKGIEWVGPCPNNHTETGIAKCIIADCGICNGTGQITRPATLEEVGELARRFVERAEIATINGGALSLKEAP